jgi:hypothetical protein
MAAKAALKRAKKAPAGGAPQQVVARPSIRRLRPTASTLAQSLKTAASLKKQHAKVAAAFGLGAATALAAGAALARGRLASTSKT